VKQFDTVVDSLQKGEKPKAICHDLKYCTVDANPAMAKLAMPSSDMISLQTSGNEGSSCAYCNGVVTVLKYALDQKPEQVKEMREAAGIVCQLLPADDTVRVLARQLLNFGKSNEEFLLACIYEVP
jgi:hypothetical protein